MVAKTLYVDEFRGFAKSKVMAALWIGLPLLSTTIRYIQPDAEGIPLLTFVGILLAGIGGTVAAVMLSTGITSERNRHVYDLFLVRPVRRRDLLIAKYFAVLTCLLIAVLLSIGLGLIVEAVSGTLTVDALENLESFMVTFTGISIACSIGIFFGIVMNSVAVSAILSAYLGNQITGLVILPVALISSLNTVLYCVIVGIAVPILFLTISSVIFERKSI